MPISYICPHCKTQATAPTEMAGRVQPCPTCGEKVTIEALPPGSVTSAQSAKAPSCVVVLINLAVVGLFVIVAAMLLFPAIHGGEAPAQVICQNNLSQISRALLLYEQTHGRFPAAGSEAKGGRPAISWRVAILPYLDRKDLYQQYDPREAWDGPKNRPIAEKKLSVYCCPTARAVSPTTSYVMIAGKGGVGGLDDGQRNLDYISSRSGAAWTLLVVEVPGAGIPWAEPRDLTIDEVIQRIKSGNREGHPGGVNVTFCDGHNRFIREDVSPEVLRALANPARKEPVDAIAY